MRWKHPTAVVTTKYGILIRNLDETQGSAVVDMRQAQKIPALDISKNITSARCMGCELEGVNVTSRTIRMRGMKMINSMILFVSASQFMAGEKKRNPKFLIKNEAFCSI